MFIYIFTFFSGLLGVFMVRKHFLLCLLSLEFMIISLYMYSMVFFSFYIYDYYFLILFLVMGVCDGVMGLSLLVFLVRSVSNDYIDNLILC
uniref:NADH-ubiquinone oxidoreductase chain 4L n=1 Tax=Achilidae gen. 1 sp. n. 1 SX-2018 TaxID=2232070 RepID=A0A3S5XHN8_9HEMI|nr:NADH dehydrogenase subunit 4L [Achilidae gen. 1 sp. n. 1 SX-2018]